MNTCVGVGAGVVAAVSAGDDFTHAYDSDDEESSASKALSQPVTEGTPRKAMTPLPDDGTVFDYFLNVSRVSVLDPARPVWTQTQLCVVCAGWLVVMGVQYASLLCPTPLPVPEYFGPHRGHCAQRLVDRPAHHQHEACPVCW